MIKMKQFLLVKNTFSDKFLNIYKKIVKNEIKKLLNA